MSEKDRLAKLLRVLMSSVENLDQEMIDQLIAGKARLSIAPSVKSKEARGSRAPIDQGQILANLNDCRDRESARRVLSEIASRDALAAFARTLKVHVVKHDRRDDIESKIIEFVIGGTLRTEAIQSLNLKGGGRPSDED